MVFVFYVIPVLIMLGVLILDLVRGCKYTVGEIVENVILSLIPVFNIVLAVVAVFVVIKERNEN